MVDWIGPIPDPVRFDRKKALPVRPSGPIPPAPSLPGRNRSVKCDNCGAPIGCSASVCPYCKAVR